MNDVVLWALVGFALASSGQATKRNVLFIAIDGAHAFLSFYARLPELFTFERQIYDPNWVATALRRPNRRT